MMDKKERIKQIEHEIARKKREIANLQFELSDLQNQLFADRYNDAGINERRRMLQRG